MNQNELKQRVVKLCFSLFKTSGIDIKLIEYVDFLEDLGLDSISFITLVVELESDFGLEIPDDKLLMDNFRNIDAIVHIIYDYISKDEETVNIDLEQR